MHSSINIESAKNQLIAEIIQNINESPLYNQKENGNFKTRDTVINFLKTINRRSIEIAMLRSLSFRGIPSEVKGLRPLVWKILLGYLPKETAKWESIIKE
jgi:hypothetical protein